MTPAAANKLECSPPASSTGEPAPWVLRHPILVLLVAALIVYYPLLSAGFIAFDDDIHVYANPFLNPPTLNSVAKFWQQPYEDLYVPLAYTIYAFVAHFAQVAAHTEASIGHVISAAPGPFHLTNIVVHFANSLLCYLLIKRASNRKATALVCSLVFLLHPLQIESVGWISELRGLASGCFALVTLNLFVLFRKQNEGSVNARVLLSLSLLSLGCAMLCKPSAAALPLIALAFDRVILGSPWRKAIVVASMWTAVVAPFVVITHSAQAIPALAHSEWWQRPFVAGDALSSYLLKVLAPTNLCVDYGRTPRLAMSHAWGYLAWVVPACLLAFCYMKRRRHPLTWLGAVIFVAFLLPTLGLAPFAYQAYSTVADRYCYLALIGIGLIVADTFEYIRSWTFATRTVSIVLAVLALLSCHQVRYWGDSSDLLRHTIDVNPDAAFAYNNLGDTELANGDLSAALSDYTACVQHDPTRVKAYINLAEVYAALGEPTAAEGALTKAEATPGMTADDFSNLGIVLMKMGQPDRALGALSTATKMQPNTPRYVFNRANALAAVGQFDKAEAGFRHCISIAPTLANAHAGLGITLAEQHRLREAIVEFRTALQLQPNDPGALDNLKRAEDLMRMRRE